jgi:ribosomal protein S19E (S16A)
VKPSPAQLRVLRVAIDHGGSVQHGRGASYVRVLQALMRRGWIERAQDCDIITTEGRKVASKIWLPSC